MGRIGIAILGASAGSKGGVDVYAVGLANALASRGVKHQYTILSSSDALGGCWITENVGRKTVMSKSDSAMWYLGLGGGSASLAEFKLTRAIDRACGKHKLDCLHFPATRITTTGIRAKAILTFFDMQYAFLPQFFTSSQAAAIDKCYRTSVGRAECIIAPTRFTLESLREKYAVPEAKMALIPAGISDTLAPASRGEIEEVRRKYGLEAQYMIYPANPWPHKNHERLLMAVRLLLDSNVPVPHLVFTGRLPGKEAILQDLVRDLRLTGHVSDLGFIPRCDIEILMSGACLMIFPSLFEGFGFPVLEAMACGCAVASANSACLPETVGDAGVLFDPTSVEGIAEAIDRLAVRGDGHSEYIRKGLARAETYKWSKVVPLLEDLYSRFESRL